MGSLTHDVAPFGIKTTIVEPGLFRTELLVEGDSTIWPRLSLDDYQERTLPTIERWKGMSGKQGGDLAKLASALIKIADMQEPPLRFGAGTDAVDVLEQKAKLLLNQAAVHRELSSNMDLV